MCGKPAKEVPCFVCGNIFSNKRSMLIHVSEVHNVSNDRSAFKCNDCQRIFEGKSTLRSHIQQLHTSKCDPSKQAQPIKCVLCDHACVKIVMLEHYNRVHDVDISTVSYNFSSLEEFLKWKLEIEKETVTKFVRYRIVKKKTFVKYFYRCHRDGWFNTHGNKIRCLKAIGSNKIDGYCPAMLKVNNYNDKVTVKYLKSHVGHKMEVNRLGISSEIKEFIIKELKNNVPLNKILTGLKESYNQKLYNVSSVKMKDLYNIRRSCRITRGTFEEGSDFFVLNKWIEDKQLADKKTIVRFYKPKGQYLVDYPELSISDFVLILMDDSQLEVLKTYGNDCVCVDPVIDILTMHDVKLTTLIVIDIVKQCYPCACFFYNRENIDVFKIFFTVLKNCTGCQLKPKIFLTDISETYYNAWYPVMGVPECCYYTSWSVQDEWNRNIRNRIKSGKKQEINYKSLKTLMKERDATKFQRLLQKTINEMNSDDDLRSFAVLFESNFRNKACSWALCFSPLEPETLANLKRMHKSIGYIYQKGWRNRRLDQAMHHVLEFLKDKLFQDGNLEKEITKINERHAGCLQQMGDFRIAECSGGSWTVTSADDKATFRVKRASLSCCCQLRCIHCACCSHTLVCTCPDHALSWNMCLHIHLVCQYLIQNNSMDSHLPPITDVSVNDNVLSLENELSQSPEGESILFDLNLNGYRSESVQRYKCLLKTHFEKILESLSNYDECELVQKSLYNLDETVKNMKISGCKDS